MQAKTWTVKNILSWTLDYFNEKNIDAPRITSELLLSKAMNLTRMKLYLNHEKPLTDTELAEYRSLIKRAAAGEPAQYIIGTQEFWSLGFKVTPDVLIPRADTETLVEALLDDIKASDADSVSILELGTGSGAICVSVAHELKGKRVCSITAVDVSESALTVARENAETNGVDDVIKFLQSDMFENVGSGERFDYIVSNPPYIAKEYYDALEKKVKDFEPKLALYGGSDGMMFYEEILVKGCEYLKENGKIFLEIDFRKKTELVRLIDPTRYTIAGYHKDLSGHDRVLELIKRGQ